MISETLSGRSGLDAFLLKRRLFYESISIGIGL